MMVKRDLILNLLILVIAIFICCLASIDFYLCYIKITKIQITILLRIILCD